VSAPLPKLKVHLDYITEEATSCQAAAEPEDFPATASMLPLLTWQLAKMPQGLEVCRDCLVAYWEAHEGTLEVAQ